MAEKTSQEVKHLMYKGKPLVREKDSFCYGNVSDGYILYLQVMTYRESEGAQLPDKMLVQILKTDTSLSDADRIVKQDVKTGLYESLDIGSIWLERQISQSGKSGNAG